MKVHPVLLLIVEKSHEKGMAKRDLALRAGLLPSSLSRLLAGRHDPGIDTLERLANVVGMRVGLLPDDDFAADVLSGRILKS